MKKIIILIVGLIILFGAGIGGGKLLADKQNQQDKTTNNIASNVSTVQQQKDEKIKEGIDAMEKLIFCDTPLDNDGKNKINEFIETTKDSDLIKNTLCNDIINKADDYINTDNNDNILFSNLKYGLDTLYKYYPNNEDLKTHKSAFIALAVKKGIMIDELKNSPQLKNSQNSNKLTSSDGNLELENDSSSDGKVLGTIKNLSSNSYSYVEADINFYDNNGNQVDSTLTNTTNLEPNGTWKFSAPILDQNRSQRYRVVSIQGQ